MSVQLHIQDGHPHWYLSPDIWVVPGNDPSGNPGSPIAGQTAYLWARVANTGSTDANGVRVDFYWANPALQVTRSNATLIGSAFADVPAGGAQAQDALCLVPWIPVIVNDGHECLVAVANHAGNSLPNPLPDAFDPPTYPQVAQKNLTVLMAGTAMLAITVSGLQRADKSVIITTELGGKLAAGTLASMGVRGLRPATEPSVEVGLDLERRCVGDQEPIGRGDLELHVPRGTSTAVYVTIRAKNLAENEYQLVQIVERAKDKVLGGLGLVVVPQRKENKEKQS